MAAPAGSTAAVPVAAARSRPAVAACLCVTIAFGLASRRWPLPGILAEHTGDGLYTGAAFWCFALVAPRLPGPSTGLAAFLSSAVVECGQLLETEWLRELRANRFGALLLGQGFQWADLVAYAAGAVAALGLDCWLFRRRHGANP